MEHFAAATREELIAIITAQQAQIEALIARVAALEEEVRRLRGGKGSGTPLAIKPSRPPKETQPRKPRDRAFVRRREPADEEVRHVVDQCPDCGRKLSDGWEHSRRQVIEVVLQRWVTDHLLWARRCGVCKKRCLPQVKASEYGVQGRSGVSGRACKVS